MTAMPSGGNVYRLMNNEFQAVQLSEDEGQFHAAYVWVESYLGKWNDDVMEPGVRKIQGLGPDCLHINLENGMFQALPGDWIVKDRFGNFSVVPDGEFWRLYQTKRQYDNNNAQKTAKRKEKNHE